MLMELGGLLLKHCLGLDSSSQDWMGGPVHEESSSGTNKVILKVGQGKREKPKDVLP